MVKGNQLCLAFIKYVFSFNNKQHFVLVPSPPMKVISFILNYLTMAKHRNDVPNSVDIIKPKAATRQLQKVLPFCLEDFCAKNNSDRSRDNK